MGMLIAIILTICILFTYRSLLLGTTASGNRFKRSIIREVNSPEVLYDLKIPLIILGIIFSVKLFIHYIQNIAVFNINFTNDTPKWITYSYAYIQGFSLGKYSELYIEYLIVTGSYFSVIMSKATKKNKTLSDNLQWIQYESELSNANHITAINLTPVEVIFEPMGFRYFLNQIIEKNKRNACNDKLPLNVSRIHILEEGENIYSSDIVNLKKDSSEMNKEYKMLYNFIELHRINGISLYFATKRELQKSVATFCASKDYKIDFSIRIVEHLPIWGYFALMVIPIIPIGIILNGLAKNIFYVLCRIFNLLRKRRTNSPNSKKIKFAELDLVNINEKYFIAKPDLTNTFMEFHEQKELSAVEIGNYIISQFALPEREANALLSKI